MSTGEGTEAYRPGTTLHLSNWKVNERVGTADNRLQAGDDRIFVSVTFADTYESEIPVELAFASDGKSYPLGEPRHGTVPCPRGGGRQDAVLEVTVEGNTQTASLVTCEITTGFNLSPMDRSSSSRKGTRQR